MKIKSQRDFWAGLMFLVTGVAFAWGALSYNFGSSARPGPAYFPFGLGILEAVLGVVVLFKALTIEVEGGDPIGGMAWKPFFYILGAVAVFGVAIVPLGLFVAMPLLVVICSFAGDEFHWGEVAANAVVMTVFCWLVFVKGLSLTIPLIPAFLSA